MRRISKGVEQGRGLQKVHLAFENILLCDAQVQPVPQKLLLVMAMVLHGPKAPPNTGLPEHLFLEFLWEAKSRFWKKNPTHPVFHFRVRQCYSPMCPFLSWLSASFSAAAAR